MWKKQVFYPAIFCDIVSTFYAVIGIWHPENDDLVSGIGLVYLVGESLSVWEMASCSVWIGELPGSSTTIYCARRVPSLTRALHWRIYSTPSQKPLTCGDDHYARLMPIPMPLFLPFKLFMSLSLQVRGVASSSRFRVRTSHGYQCII